MTLTDNTKFVQPLPYKEYLQKLEKKASEACRGEPTRDTFDAKINIDSKRALPSKKSHIEFWYIFVCVELGACLPVYTFAFPLNENVFLVQPYHVYNGLVGVAHQL